MTFFTPVEGAVLLKQNGTYREAPLLRNDKGELFAKRGSAAIRLMPHHGTSIPKIYWNEIQCQDHWEIFGCYLVLSSFIPSTARKKKAA